MNPGCDMVDVGAEAFLEGARDLESFAKAMKKRFGRDLKPDVLHAAFNKAADKFEFHNAPINTVKLELAKELAASRRSGFLETFTALRRAGLISGVRTQVRNIVGNTGSAAFDAVSRIPAALADMAIGKFTGNRTTLLVNPEATKRAIQSAVTRGIKDWGEVLKHGATATDLAKFDIPRELNAYIGKVELKPINAYVNYINRFQSGADKPYREYAFMRSLVEQAQIEGKAKKLKGDELKKFVESTVKEPTDAMLLQAIADGEEAVFANRNQITDLLRPQSAGAKFALDTIVPFKRVPTNITGRVIESNAIGGGIKIAKLITEGVKNPEVQRELVKTFGRATTGSSLIYLGYRLAEQNLATGNYPVRNQGLSQRMEATNEEPSAFIINGQQIKLGDSPPGMLLALGASIFRDTAEGDRPGGLIGSAAKNLGLQVAGMPMLEGVKSGVESMSDPENAGERFSTSLAGSLVPTWAADVAQAMDGKTRKAQTAIDAIKARVPFLREDVPIKYDALGKMIEPPSIWNILDGGVLKSDPVSSALRENRVNITRPQRKKAEPGKPEETDAQYWARVRESGEAVYTELDALVKSAGFKSLPPAEKKTLLESAIKNTKAAYTRSRKG